MKTKLLAVLSASILCLATVVVLARCGRTSEDILEEGKINSTELKANPSESKTLTPEVTPTPTPPTSTPTPTPTPMPTPTPTPEPHVVVLDPGHGGKWAGAWYLGISEKDITLKVANYCRSYLENNYKDVKVLLTREDDGILDPDIAIDLEKRVLVGADNKAEAFVSIHFNACDAHNMSGSEAWSSRREHMKDATYALGRAIMDELAALGLRDRGVNTRRSESYIDENGIAYDYYGIVRHCATYNVVGVIVEHCFMDNEHDQVFILSEDGLRSLGEADAKGIAAYLGLEKKETTGE